MASQDSSSFSSVKGFAVAPQKRRGLEEPNLGAGPSFTFPAPTGSAATAALEHELEEHEMFESCTAIRTQKKTAQQPGVMANDLAAAARLAAVRAMLGGGGPGRVAGGGGGGARGLPPAASHTTALKAAAACAAADSTPATEGHSNRAPRLTHAATLAAAGAANAAAAAAVAAAFSAPAAALPRRAAPMLVLPGHPASDVPATISSTAALHSQPPPPAAQPSLSAGLTATAAGAVSGVELAAWLPVDASGVQPDAEPPAAAAATESSQALPLADASPADECAATLVVPVGSIVAEVAAGVPPQTLTHVGVQDFTVLRVVGQGAFGKVFQVQYKGDGRVYAMKVMRKERIVALEHSEYVLSEREVLTAVSHPYIVAMRFSFQSPSKLYLVLDFVNGGHLFFNLYREGVFSEDVARLYAAEMVCAISYLHGAGIVHRDLKPENVLLDHEGHIKITDFGLAKGNLHSEADRTNSFIGTLEYMAPEIIQGEGHGKAVDWWSIGVLLYEMLCGLPPFRAKSRTVLQNLILTSKPKFPKFISNDAQNLLKALLTRDVSKRLGCGPGGSDAVKRHPFFRAISWARLERREVPSKFRPAVANSMDIANFDKVWTEQKPEDSPCGTPTSPSTLDRHAQLFQNYSYVSPAFLASSMECMTLTHAARSGGSGGSSGGTGAGASLPPAADESAAHLLAP